MHQYGRSIRTLHAKKKKRKKKKGDIFATLFWTPLCQSQGLNRRRPLLFAWCNRSRLCPLTYRLTVSGQRRYLWYSLHFLLFLCSLYMFLNGAKTNVYKVYIFAIRLHLFWFQCKRCIVLALIDMYLFKTQIWTFMMLLLQTVSLRGLCIGLENGWDDVVILPVKCVCVCKCVHVCVRVCACV